MLGHWHCCRIEGELAAGNQTNVCKLDSCRTRDTTYAGEPPSAQLHRPPPDVCVMDAEQFDRDASHTQFSSYYQARGNLIGYVGKLTVAQ